MFPQKINNKKYKKRDPKRHKINNIMSRHIKKPLVLSWNASDS